jgi:hypothetical protein
LSPCLLVSYLGKLVTMIGHPEQWVIGAQH